MEKNYDLIIVGGGTAGCSAAYTAGKLGLKTLVIEKGIHLGGTITSALVVPVMMSGENQINTDFYDALTNKLKELGGQVTYQNNKGWFNPELTKIAIDSLLEGVGVDILFNTTVKSVELNNDNLIKGLYISSEILSECNCAIQNTKEQLSVYIEARYYLDSTGDAIFSKICGCEFLNSENEFQPTSLRFMLGGVDLETFANWLEKFDINRNVTTVENIDGQIHLSTAYTWDKDNKWALAPLFEDAISKNILKDTDCNYFQIFTVAGMSDTVAFNCPRLINCTNCFDTENVSKSLIEGRKAIFRLTNFCKIYLKGFEKSYISNIADMLGIRVSRRIKGKYIYTIDDLKQGKLFKNPVLISNYPIDVHSKDKNSSTLSDVGEYQLPVESLMSTNIKNLFVAGRCLSADFMAQGALRVQASCFSMGEGVAKYIKSII